MSSVTVMGAGIWGLASAFIMGERGARVTVIEADRPGAGASGGTVGALSPFAPENWNDLKALQLGGLLAAPDFWDAVARRGGGTPGYARLGRLQPVDDRLSGRLEQRLAEGARRWGAFAPKVIARPASPLAEADAGPWHWDGISGRLDPTAAVAALVAAIRAQGAEIRQGSAPDEAAPGPVLWTTGVAGLEALSRDLGREVGGPQKGQSATLAADFPNEPQIYVGGVHIVPHANGTIGIGSTSERQFEHLDTDAQLDEIITRVRTHCPALRDAPVVRRWAGLRPRATTRWPIFGAWPDRPGHFVANGGFKIAFGLAPAVGELMADLVLDGTDRIPPGLRLTRAGKP